MESWTEASLIKHILVNMRQARRAAVKPFADVFFYIQDILSND